MYIPEKYENTDLAAVREFLNANAFGMLITQVNGRPWATHIPLELEEEATGEQWLIGHIAKANPQWRSFDDQKEVLCVFNGPHSYVSSSWYQEEEVPTWNYIAVHVYGELSILSEAAVMESLHKLVDKYERDSDTPLSLSAVSPHTLRQVRGVVGFRIRVREIRAAFKLSQGREADHPRIIQELEKRGSNQKAVAAEMRKSGK